MERKNPPILPRLQSVSIKPYAIVLWLFVSLAACTAMTEQPHELQGAALNGELASRDDYPFHVEIQTLFLGSSNFYRCEASIVGRDWVLGAAHCVIQDHRTRDVSVVVKQDGEWAGVREVYDPGYVEKRLDGKVRYHSENDIALLFAPGVGEGLEDQDFARLADAKSHPGDVLKALGWQDPLDRSAFVVKHFVLPDDELCEKGNEVLQDDGTFDVGFDASTDLCLGRLSADGQLELAVTIDYGNSGGPLLHGWARKGRPRPGFELVGVHSSLANATSVFAFRDWIENTIRNQSAEYSNP